MLFRLLIVFVFIAALCAGAFAEIKVPSFVSDGMVLQRDVKVNIWGKASPGEKVTVAFNHKTYLAQTGADSAWHVKLDAAPAGGPYEMTLKGSNTISIKNIMLGDVWLCGGQSNMAMQLKNKYAEGVDYTANPMIRQLLVEKGYNFNTRVDIKSSGWKEFNKDNADEYSAVAYWFAKMLFDKYHVTIGLINSSVGGTPAQAWVSEEGLKEFPWFLLNLKKVKDTIQTAHYIGSLPKLTSTPSILSRTMIDGLVGYTIKGIIFYQGEANANTDRAHEYYQLFPALINDWRRRWQQPDLPFIYVQLANFNGALAAKVPGGWAELRDAQRSTLKLNNTAMVVTHDIGNPVNIHPFDKKTVGYRLSLAAEKLAYHDDEVVYSGPLFKKYTVDGNKIICEFDHTGSGLQVKDGASALSWFVISDASQHFVKANAVIKDNKVIVWSDAVTNPVAVRYAWGNNPLDANLFNKEGLPASVFRTDDWPDPWKQMMP